MGGFRDGQAFVFLGQRIEREWIAHISESGHSTICTADREGRDAHRHPGPTN